MDEQRARELLGAERARVERLLEDARASQRMNGVDEQIIGDDADEAQRLTAEGTDEAFLRDLRDRLGALDRAEQRLEEGTYGRSVRSGAPLPDERLAADPAAELTVEEAEEDQQDLGASQAA
jgi:DnaK suppressor protein